MNSGFLAGAQHDNSINEGRLANWAESALFHAMTNGLEWGYWYALVMVEYWGSGPFVVFGAAYPQDVGLS
jgi:hypothetical protein